MLLAVVAAIPMAAVSFLLSRGGEITAGHPLWWQRRPGSEPPPRATARCRCPVGIGQLMAANSVLAASESGAVIVGLGVGGALVRAIGPAALLADAASFLVSAGSLAAIRTVEAPPAPRPSGRRLRQEIGAGLRYVWSHPLIRSVVVTGTLANLVIGGYNAVDILSWAASWPCRPAWSACSSPWPRSAACSARCSPPH